MTAIGAMDSYNHNTNLFGSFTIDDNTKSSTLSGEDHSSNTSNGTYDRLRNAPVLPSANSAANMKKVANTIEKLRAWQKKPSKPGGGWHTQILSKHSSSNTALAPREPGPTSTHSFHTSEADSLRSSVPIRSVLDAVRGTESQDDSLSRSKSGLWVLSEATRGRIDQTAEDPAAWRFEEHWRRLRDQRSTLNHTLAKIGREQNVLQDIRQQKSHAHAQLDIAIQEILHQHPQLGHRLEGIRSLELVNQAHESVLEDLLNDLRKGEAQVEFEERQFFTGETVSRRSSSASSRASLRGIEGVRPEIVDPLFNEFQDAIREFYLAREWKSELFHRKQRLDSKNPGALTLDDRECLDDFEEDWHNALSELNHWTHQAGKLERLCRERNVIPKDSSLEEPGSWLNRGARDEITLGPVSSSLAHPEFPLLLSNPKNLIAETFPKTAREYLAMMSSLLPATIQKQVSVEDAKKELEIERLLSEPKDQTKQDFVNRWMLQRLRQSALEVELLLTVGHSSYDIIDRNKWQRDVLSFWIQDEPARPNTTSPQPGPDDTRDTSSQLMLDHPQPELSEQVFDDVERPASAPGTV